MDLTYTTVCVWAVTVAGSVAVLAFAVYFVITVWRLVRVVAPVSAPTSRVTDLEHCSCGGDLGPVISLLADDAGQYERRKCHQCHRTHIVPRQLPPT